MSPDPKTVREIAAKVANIALHDSVHVDQWISAVASSELGDCDVPTFVAYLTAIRRRLAIVTVEWPDEQQPADVVTAEQQQDGAVEAPCVCGDPNCAPYWRPVHQQMNEIRLRSDRAAADFTKAMLEEICEERTRAEQAEAGRAALAERVAKLESEREADTRAVAAFQAASGQGIGELAAAGWALVERFADRVAALDVGADGSAE